MEVVLCTAINNVPKTNSIIMRTIMSLRCEQEDICSSACWWVSAMQSDDLLIRNWYASMALVKNDDHTLPIAIGNPHPEQTYLASAISGYIHYARDELDQIQDERIRRWAGRALQLAEPWMKQLRLDQAVSMNAWGVSTHLYPQWMTNALNPLMEQLTQNFPERPLWLRSLNAHQHTDLMTELQQLGWTILPYRQIYLFHPEQSEEWLTRRNNQIDQKRLRSTHLYACNHDEFTHDDCTIMANLYQQLYLDKHSRWNAIYTPRYFELALKHRWLTFTGFRDEQGKLIAFIGLYHDNDTITTPMLGYDTRLPQSLGLYRLLMASVLRSSIEQNRLLNLGAGAANFKKMRGGQAEIEWQAFYTGHLPWYQNMKLSLTRWAMHKTIPKFLAKQAV